MIKNTIITSVCALFLILFSGNMLAVAQTEQDKTSVRQPRIYTIYDIFIDETARSADQARRIALAKGQRQALDKLFQKIIRMEDMQRLPEFDSRQVSELVSGFEIGEEKSSRVRYMAKLTVHFSREKIYDLLSSMDIPFAETLSNSVLVVPVMEQGGAVLLWQNTNVWLKAWQAFDTINNLVPVEVPHISLENRMSLNAWQAHEGQGANLEDFRQKKGLDRLYVAMAKIEQDISSNETALNLTLRDGDTGEVAYEIGIVHKIDPENRQEDMAELYLAAIQEATTWIDDQWKQRVLVHFDSGSRVELTVMLDEPKDWFDVRARLENISLIRGLVIKEITIHTVVIQLDHVGDMDQIMLALAQENLDLVDEQGQWMLTIRDKGRN